MRILLAEDEESIARALKLMLEKNKYTVDLVFNGADALEHIMSAAYDALVLDIMMPGMDGIEVLTRARAGGITAPALFLTAKGEVRLNNKEYQLMELFMRHPRQVFSTMRLMERVWELNSESDMDVVWTYIGFLRRKLRQLGADVEIKTIRGAGYVLERAEC